jgi:glycolate oxidase FAD binding subunit
MTGIAGRLRQVAGADAVRSAAGERVQGVAPAAVVEPEDEAAVAAVLALCSAEGWRVEVAGATGRGMRGGRVPERVDVLLRTARLARAPEHAPEDLTVSVDAGTRIAGLQDHLAAANQILPLDPPGVLARSVGGVVAERATGPLRQAFGSARDMVLGLTLVTGDGRLLRLGGKVVKNVAGYDLTRLAIGSRGALGVITHIHFRLFPKPLVDCTLRVSGTVSELAAMAREVLALEPAALEIVAGDGGAGLLVRFMGAAETVAWQADRLGVLSRGVRTLSAEVATRCWTDVYKSEHEAGLLLRWSSLPDRTMDTLAAAGRLAAELDETLKVASDNNLLYAHAGMGEVRSGWRRLRAGVDWMAVAGRIEAAREEFEAAGGSLAAVVLPAELAARLEPWGARDSAVAELGERVRRGFDPAGILMTGRVPV